MSEEVENEESVVFDDEEKKKKDSNGGWGIGNFYMFLIIVAFFVAVCSKLD